ncbi:MAG: ABC transporter ATP-binding protein [Bacteriovoracia bacterium]
MTEVSGTTSGPSAGTTPSASPLIAVEGLTKSFRKGREEVVVLKGIDLQIRSGEMIAITGASGVGKSTLLHVIGTLEAPTQGKVLFGKNRDNVFAYSDTELARFRNKTMGFVFQFHYLLPEFSALENVMMPALIAGHPRGSAEKQARELLKFVGLEHRLSHRPSELSGGEQQRVSIARAVILRPKLLLADELTGNLDSANEEIVMSLLTELNQATGISIIIVTHDLSLAERMHRSVVMEDGRIVPAK